MGNTISFTGDLWLVVEMMCFAGCHGNKDSHIRSMSRGGEFLTIVWLLTEHLVAHARAMDLASTV